jgi:hypothetical protein
MAEWLSSAHIFLPLSQPCSYTIIVDVPWTYADLTQLTGRTIRMGQERLACIAVLLVEGTFEMRIWSLVEAKRVGDQ